jgi:hypothetical protein
MKALTDGFVVAGLSRSLGEGTEAWLLRLGPDGLLAEGCNAYLGSSTAAFRTQTLGLSHRSVPLAPIPAATPVDVGAAVTATGVPETVVARQCFGTAGAVTTATSTLTVTQPGTLTGTVTSTPSGIVCGTASAAGCAAPFATGATALLDVDPGSAVNFLRWEDCDEVLGDASGAPQCRVRMTRDRTVRAVFGQPTDRFALRLTVSGTGTVTSGDGGIRCGVFFGPNQHCEAGYDAIIPGTSLPDSINLAVFTNRADFVGWGGDCAAAGDAAAFNLVMDADKNCTATFAGAPASLDLTVQTTGTGSGVVTSTPAGISCEATCTAAFAANETVILFAGPMGGSNASAFDGWTGCDRLRQVPGDSIPACEVDMNASRSVSAAFTLGPPPPSTQFTLTVQRVGFAALVMSTPRGIECGLACSASFASNQTVRLAVTLRPGLTLSGWTGCDRMPVGTSAPFDCEVDMTADRNVQVRIE